MACTVVASLIPQSILGLSQFQIPQYVNQVVVQQLQEASQLKAVQLAFFLSNPANRAMVQDLIDIKNLGDLAKLTALVNLTNLLQIQNIIPLQNLASALESAESALDCINQNFQAFESMGQDIQSSIRQLFSQLNIYNVLGIGTYLGALGITDTYLMNYIDTTKAANFGNLFASENINTVISYTDAYHTAKDYTGVANSFVSTVGLMKAFADGDTLAKEALNNLNILGTASQGIATNNTQFDWAFPTLPETILTTSITEGSIEGAINNASENETTTKELFDTPSTTTDFSNLNLTDPIPITNSQGTTSELSIESQKEILSGGVTGLSNQIDAIKSQTIQLESDKEMSIWRKKLLTLSQKRYTQEFQIVETANRKQSSMISTLAPVATVNEGGNMNIPYISEAFRVIDYKVKSNKFFIKNEADYDILITNSSSVQTALETLGNTVAPEGIPISNKFTAPDENNSQLTDQGLNMVLTRKWFTDKSTIGILQADKLQFYTLEDMVRPYKIYGETAIPAGKYEVRITWSPKFGQQMPILLNVPNFTGIRIHSGNTSANTTGCILVGKTKGNDIIYNSRVAYTELMNLLNTIKSPQKIYITIIEQRT